MRTARILAGGVAAAAVAAAFTATGSAENTKIFGVVGPGFSITLSDASGAKITHLDAGTYDLVVDDKSEFHNFHLIGTGVDVTTEVETSGEKTFTVTLTDGIYKFQCDPHIGDMNGQFAVGTASLPSSSGGSASGGSSSGGSSSGGAKTTPAKAFSAPVGAKLSLGVGPGFTIGLKTGAGKAVTSLAAGAYTFNVNDKASAHNAHLTGPGVNKATTVPFVGKQTWKLTLKKGTYTFVCDPHKTGMKGSFKVS